MLTRLTIAIVITILSLQTHAQSVSLGFYNVENLFDTIKSPFYDDENTPKGRKAWDTKRYLSKIDNIAKVIDEMSCDVIGLCEVENENVVISLIKKLKTDYNYIHYTSSDRRGLDVVLLYKADVFIPTNSQLISSSYREPMVVDGLLYGNEVSIIVCHMPSRLNSQRIFHRAFSSIIDWHAKVYDPKRSLIIMGDLNCSTTENGLRKLAFSRDEYYDLLTQIDNPVGRKCRDIGSYLYDGTWYLYDNILIDRRLSNGAVGTLLQCGVFAKPYLFFESYKDRHSLNSSYYKGRYNGGYSDHLPIFITLDLR